MGKKVLIIALGAAVAGYVLASRRRPSPTGQTVNGGSPASGDQLRRVVGEARDRIQAEAENA